MLSEGVNVHHCDCNYSAVPNTTLCISQIKASEANNELKHEKSSETHLPLSDSRGSNKQFALDYFLSTWKAADQHFQPAPGMPAWRFTQEAKPMLWYSHKNTAVQRVPARYETICSSQKLQPFGCGRAKTKIWPDIDRTTVRIHTAHQMPIKTLNKS